MDRQEFDDWLRRYFEAWVSNDPDEVGAVFAEDAVYHVDPFSGPRMRGRREIVERWTSEPDAQQDVRWSYEPLALAGDRGIAQWRVSFAPGGAADRRTEVDRILVITFDAEGRCTEHREWQVTRDVETG
jgi:ketosteroid isomerase-like protein